MERHGGDMHFHSIHIHVYSYTDINIVILYVYIVSFVIIYPNYTQVLCSNAFQDTNCYLSELFLTSGLETTCHFQILGVEIW